MKIISIAMIVYYGAPPQVMYIIVFLLVTYSILQWYIIIIQLYIHDIIMSFVISSN